MFDKIEKQQHKRRNRIKYNIHGFNQIEAIRMGLSLDDLAVLRWFIDYKDSKTMERYYVEEINDIVSELDYKILIDELPILLLEKESIDRILDGPLSQIIKLIIGESSEKYMYIDRNNYSKLIANQNIYRKEDN